MYTITPVTQSLTWNEQVESLGGHPLQKWGWGELKSAHNWSATRLTVTIDDELVALAQVLHRSLPAPFKSLSHVPRGPVFAASLDAAGRTAATDAIVAWVKKNVGGVGITIETDLDAVDSVAVTGAKPSPNPILYPTTLILDTRLPADELLGACSKSTRYDIRKGAKNNLDIRRVVTDEELEQVLRTYRENAARAGFAIHSDGYYRDIHHLLGEDSFIAACFADGEVASFVWLARSGQTWFELYASANDTGRRLRANAPVKWFAIQAAKEAGAPRYDMNGLLNDGISEFKRSFSKHENQLQPSVDVAFSFLHGAWNTLLPSAKAVLRKLRR
ncbi:lipid II:glycine glycyltransferase FemX [Populibacterium corticicola]|uniref:Lipid II:glycine glycyltransferase FemX n=1 Tax=Populibacterium corticicola TaxID=1812826 RepID=A0ABW5XBQ2_9MICO